MEDGSAAAIVLFLFVVALVIYFLPAAIAFTREHEYRWVIFALNLFGGITIILWIAAFVWAVFPHNRTFADPILGSATGKGERNIGDAVGASVMGVQRGYARGRGAGRNEPPFETPAVLSGPAPSKVELLERLRTLQREGALTDEEFESAKRKLLDS